MFLSTVMSGNSCKCKLPCGRSRGAPGFYFSWREGLVGNRAVFPHLALQSSLRQLESAGGRRKPGAWGGGQHIRRKGEIVAEIGVRLRG